MNRKEVKYGAILSYILIIANTLYGFIVSPYLVGTLGTSEFGVYKAIGSITSSIMVLDVGIGATVQRYVAKFRAEGNSQQIGSYTGMGLMVSAGINVLILLVCAVIYASLDKIYGASFSVAELEKAHKVFALFILQMVLHIFENVIHGTISGLNRFMFANSLKLATLVLRTVAVYCLLPAFRSAMTLLYISIGVEVFLLTAELLFLYLRCDVRIRFTRMERGLFKESGIYTLMMFVQAMTAQVNANLDNTIIGALIGTVAVTVYSFGLTIFNMFQQLSTAISGVMLPTVTNELKDGADGRRLEDLVISAGRVQFLLLGSALVGFCIIGQDFIKLWLGQGFEDVWLITLILMIPAIWELSQNVCLSILRAKNLLGVRTIALLCGTVLNFLISWFGTKYFGYYAAALGTAFSITAASLITMNIYYYRVLHLNILRIFGQILKHTLPLILCAASALLLAHFLLQSVTWFALAAKIAVYLLVGGLVLVLHTVLRRKRKEA